MSLSHEIISLGPPPTAERQPITSLPEVDSSRKGNSTPLPGNLWLKPREALEALTQSKEAEHVEVGFTPLHTRREVLKTLAALGVSTAVLGLLKKPTLIPIPSGLVNGDWARAADAWVANNQPQQTDQRISPYEPLEDVEDWYDKLKRDRYGNILPFDNTETNKITNELGFGVVDFFYPKQQLLRKLTTPLNSVPLMPIFPPSVLMGLPGELNNQDMIKTSAQKYQVPANIVAWLMTTESMGNRDYEEGKKIGLFGVPMGLFGKDISIEEMKDPTKNAEYALKRLFDCFNKAKYRKANLSEGELWGYALLAYKYGEAILEKQYEELSFEQKLYFDNYARTMIFTEVAFNLKKKGKADRDVISSLASTTLDHRLSTLNQLAKYNKNGKFDLAAFDKNAPFPPPEDYWKEAVTQVAQQRPEFYHTVGAPDFKTNTGSEMGNSLYMFTGGGPDFKLKIPPHIRMFMLTGGDNLLQSDPRNKDENNWNTLTID